MNVKIVPRDKEHLVELIRQEIKAHGLCCSLNHLDVSGLTTLKYVFMDSRFNGDISEWDVSNVENMEGLFQNSSFNGDISKWNTSKVWNLCATFAKSAFTGDISLWDTSNVVNLSETFKYSDFTGDISGWDTGKVLTMASLFEGNTKFQGVLSSWNVSRVEDFRDCFRGAFYCGDISYWNMKATSNKENMLRTIYLNSRIQLPRSTTYDDLVCMCGHQKMSAKSYLHQQPELTLAHLEYALRVKKKPIWMPQDVYDHALSIRSMGISLGLETKEIAHGLLNEIVFKAPPPMNCGLSDFTMTD